MAAAGIIITFIFTGEEDEEGNYIVPENATHVSIHESITVIPTFLFFEHKHIVELICHDGVEKIERYALGSCHSLRRVIIPGVRVLEESALDNCTGVTCVQCRKLEFIGARAFAFCEALNGINLTSVKVVKHRAFFWCRAMMDAKFGAALESMEWRVFYSCRSLESITIPMKNLLIYYDDIFTACVNLKRVDLVEEEVLNETIDALNVEGWRNDVKRTLQSFNQTLPNVYAGKEARRVWRDGEHHYDEDDGLKAQAIRNWIRILLGKIISYKRLHRISLLEYAANLRLASPNHDDIVLRNVLPFLEMPLHRFDGEDEKREGRGDMVMARKRRKRALSL